MREGGHRPEAFAKGRRDEGVVVDIMIVAMIKSARVKILGSGKKGLPPPPSNTCNAIYKVGRYLAMDNEFHVTLEEGHAE